MGHSAHSPSQDPDDLMMSAMNAATPRPVNNSTDGLLCLVYLALLFTVAAWTQSHLISGQLYGNPSSSAYNYLSPKDRVPL